MPVQVLPINEPLLAAEAARRLAVSVKTLRLYEQHGLLQPARSHAGYRNYSAADMRAAQDVVALRRLGLGLKQVALALAGDTNSLDAALARREAELTSQFATLHEASVRLRELRRQLAAGKVLQAGVLADGLAPQGAGVSFPLPWPWGGEQFTLEALAPLTYLVGPQGSGKTRLALQLVKFLPNALYVGPGRFKDPEQFERDLRLTRDQAQRVDLQLDQLRRLGAVDTAQLRLLLVALEADGGERPLVIDMIEDGLSQASQEAFMPWLRNQLVYRSTPVIAMTRSSSILELQNVAANEAILFCPANHSAPVLVAPHPVAAGYEALQSCLATPRVRARLASVPTD